MYYLVFADSSKRNLFLELMRDRGVNCAFHYVPLHSPSFGKTVSRSIGDLPNTQKISESIVRLPLYIGVEQQEVVSVVNKCFELID